MSLIDKVIAAVTPPESERARVDTRARSLAAPGGWLEMVLDHHELQQKPDAVVQVRLTRRCEEEAGRHFGVTAA